MQLPVLSIIIFSPIIAAVLVFLLPRERVKEIKALALASTVLSLLLSLYVYFAYNVQAGGYQFTERLEWLPSLGISYLVGVDGISAPLVLLTGLVACSGVMISWGVAERPKSSSGSCCCWRAVSSGCLPRWICSCCSSFSRSPYSPSS